MVLLHLLAGVMTLTSIVAAAMDALARHVLTRSVLHHLIDWAGTLASLALVVGWVDRVVVYGVPLGRISQRREIATLLCLEEGGDRAQLLVRTVAIKTLLVILLHIKILFDS